MIMARSHTFSVVTLQGQAQDKMVNTLKGHYSNAQNIKKVYQWFVPSKKAKELLV